MPTNGRPKLTVRLDEDEQARFVVAARNKGTDGASLVRRFIAWYLQEPDSELPERPTATQIAEWTRAEVPLANNQPTGEHTG